MKKEIIFCVDDEKIVLNSLKSELKNAFGDKYIIETAESGIEALEEIENLLNLDYQVPIVIVDYAMPIMKGDELLEKIHKLSPDILKILLISCKFKKKFIKHIWLIRKNSYYEILFKFNILFNA